VSRWTHSICDACWEKREPQQYLDPYRLEDQEEETCCFCSQRHRSGIYIRSHWADLPCNGETGPHQRD
jgi:hypothetical protein